MVFTPNAACTAIPNKIQATKNGIHLRPFTDNNHPTNNPKRSDTVQSKIDIPNILGFLSVCKSIYSTRPITAQAIRAPE